MTIEPSVSQDDDEYDILEGSSDGDDEDGAPGMPVFDPQTTIPGGIRRGAGHTSRPDAGPAGDDGEGGEYGDEDEELEEFS